MIEPDLFLGWPATPIASREEKEDRRESGGGGGGDNRTGAEAESGREETLYFHSVLNGKEITSVRLSFAEVPKAPAAFCRQSDHWILGLRRHFVRNIWP